MTEREAEMILLESLVHSEETKSDYFLNKAKESNTKMVHYSRALMNAYNRLDEYVNIKNYTAWTVDEKTGLKEYIKTPLILDHYTGGKILGQLDCHNIHLIGQPLVKFVREVLAATQEPEKKQHEKTSYEWKANPDKELPELYSLMIDAYKLIASETTYEQFEAVFTGQPIDDSFEPIRWHQENASELLYFIVKLEQSDSIVHDPKRADYKKLMSCFVTPDGMQFKANWKQLKQNISANLSPDKQEAINALIDYFL